jgi:DNA-binding NtrC family response regulator
MQQSSKLEERIKSGLFREDSYRLNIVTVHSLNEKEEKI